MCSSLDWVKPKTRISICCFSGKHAASRRKSKDLFVRNHDNVSSGAVCLSVDGCFRKLAL